MLRTLASRVEPLTWLLFIGLLLLVVGMSAFRWLDPDEMEALQAAWKAGRLEDLRRTTYIC